MQHPIERSISSLLARCAEAPTESPDWSHLVERLTPTLRGVVAGTLNLCRARRRADLVDELVQEIWCRLLAADRRALRGFRGGGDPEASAYLRRIASRVVFDRLRSESAGKRMAPGLAAIDAADTLHGGEGDLRGCPERRLLARERARQFAALCGELVGSGRRRERLAIARLAFVEGRSSREIVARLGGAWSEGRVNSFLFRLRRRLAGRGFAPRARAREVAA